MLSRENLHLVKFLIFLWSRNTPRDTQSVETRNAFILPRWNASQLILAKIGVPSDGKNPVERLLRTQKKVGRWGHRKLLTKKKARDFILGESAPNFKRVKPSSFRFFLLVVTFHWILPLGINFVKFRIYYGSKDGAF